MRNRKRQLSAALALVLVCALFTGVASAAGISLKIGEFNGVLGEKEVFGCVLTEGSAQQRILSYSWTVDGHYRRDYKVTLDDNDKLVRMDVVMYDYDTSEMTGIYTFAPDNLCAYAQFNKGEMELVVENNAGTCMVHFYKDNEYIGSQDASLSDMKGYPNYFTQMTLETYDMYDGSTSWGVFVDDAGSTKARYMCMLSQDGSCSVIDSFDGVSLQYTHGDNFYVQDGVWYCYEDGHVEEKQ